MRPAAAYSLLATRHPPPIAHGATSVPESGFPVGRYQLVLALDFCGEPEDQYSEVALTGSGLSPEVEDTFAWVRR